MLEGRVSGAHNKFTAERNALIEWFERRGAILPRTYCRQFGTVATGAEHCVFFDLERFCAIKITHPNRFGHSVYAEGAHATPLEYLRRLGAHNVLLGDDIRLIGCVLDEEGFQIISSQPWITTHPTVPVATEAQIDALLMEIRFRRSQLFLHGHVFYSSHFNLVIGDAHSGNVLVSEHGEIVPIDLVIGYPGPALKAQLRSEFPPDTDSDDTSTTLGATPELGMPSWGDQI